LRSLFISCIYSFDVILYRFDSAQQLNTIASYVDSMRFNFVEYLRDAKLGITQTAEKTQEWSLRYDLSDGGIAESIRKERQQSSNQSSNTNSQFNHHHHSRHHYNYQQQKLLQKQQQQAELDYDAEEFLLHLNLYSIESSSKSRHSTMSLFANSSISKQNGCLGHQYLAAQQQLVDYENEDEVLEKHKLVFDEPISSKSESNQKSNGNRRQKMSKKKLIKSSEDLLRVQRRTQEILKLNMNNGANNALDMSNNSLSVTAADENNREEKAKRTESRKSRRRAAANDFYILAFDNELSGSSASSSRSSSHSGEGDSSPNRSESSSSLVNKEASGRLGDNLDEDNDEDYDEELTNSVNSTNSVSSTATLNNENSGLLNSIREEANGLNRTEMLVLEKASQGDHQLKKERKQSTDVAAESELLVSLEYRKNLVDYFFANEEKSKLYLSTSLNNFLNALDDIFKLEGGQALALALKSDKSTSCRSGINDELNSLCEQIMNVYNELFALKRGDPDAIKSSKSDECAETGIGDAQTNNSSDQKQSSVINLTTFPVYVDDSLNESAGSLSAEAATSGDNLIIDNSCLSSLDECSSKEGDIGPFLCALFGRLDHMLTNSIQLNFLLTGLLARLAYYPQLLLRSFLLNHNLVMQPNIKSLIQVIASHSFCSFF
jgi:hypothetical protein